MKRTKFNRFLGVLLIATIVLSSCVDNLDTSLPPIEINEPNITTNLTVASIQERLIEEFNTNRNSIYTYTGTQNPGYVTGYVVSSDAKGNFFQTLVVQDSPENPTAGIEVKINNSSLSETYEVGRKVYIKLEGLTVQYLDGQSNDPTATANEQQLGKFSLGYGINRFNDVDLIPSSLISNQKQIVRSSEVATIIPTTVEIGSITQANINTMVQLENAQFQISELGKSFAGEANDRFDGLRTIFECNSKATIPLETSTFSDFKRNIVPAGKGTANVVLNKSFREEFLVAIINNPEDLNFTDNNRCDPIFEESFENTTLADLITEGWYNINANGGSELYETSGFGGNSFIQGSAFRSGENPLEMWLVTPEVDLDNSSDEVLSFETKTGFNNGQALSLFYSTNFTGDINTATWTSLNATFANGPSSGFGSFESSGNIDISDLTGKVVFAFRYLGGDGNITTTFQIDNIEISSN